MGKEQKLVLVTGANGFVGSHLVEGLLEKGYTVRCMVRRTSDLSYIRDLPVEWAYASLDDDASLRQACTRVDAVYHCAALTRAQDEKTFQQANTQGTVRLAKACLEQTPDIERFVFASSLAACGPAPGPEHLLYDLCGT